MQRDTPTYYNPSLPIGWEKPAYDIIPDPVYGFVDFVGELFSWGLAAGSAFHFNKGFRCAPRGARLAGAVNAVRRSAPGVAGKFAACYVLCFAMENAVSRATGRGNIWTAAAAVGATCGIVHGMRRPAAAWYALLGATGYMGMEYGIRVWEIKTVKELDRERNPVEERVPVLIVPGRAAGPTDNYVLSQ